LVPKGVIKKHFEQTKQNKGKVLAAVRHAKEHMVQERPVTLGRMLSTTDKAILFQKSGKESKVSRADIGVQMR
jgi:DNA primase